MNTATTANLYYIDNTDTSGTPFESLYGDLQVVFSSHAEADAAVTNMNTDELWGPNGDQTAEAAGFRYYIEEADGADGLEDVSETHHEQAVALLAS